MAAKKSKSKSASKQKTASTNRTYRAAGKAKKVVLQAPVHRTHRLVDKIKAPKALPKSEQMTARAQDTSAPAQGAVQVQAQDAAQAQTVAAAVPVESQPSQTSVSSESQAPAQTQTLNPAPAPQKDGILGNIDTKKAAIAAAIIIALIAIGWFVVLPMLQGTPIDQGNPFNSNPSSDHRVSVIANSRLPSQFQVVVKNNENKNVFINGITIGNTDYNLTANLTPGEIRAFDVYPPQCSQEQEYNCNILIKYVIYGTGETVIIESGASGTNTQPPANGSSGNGSSGNEGNGNGGTGTGRGPLVMETNELAQGTIDLVYGFSLEA
ncbi:MAG: hypothetical protein NTV88_04055, partial [Candidatus Micrarchaeota archaeon]|nr:hypothetical protein [Candidatus Micrarchaeota archaeon]